MVTKTLKKFSLLPVITVKTEDTVIEVAKKLCDFQERRIFVLDNKKFPVGIISIVDINDRVVARGKDPKKTKAKEIMSYPLTLIADINDSSQEILKKMIQKDNYYVPVVEKGILKGLITYATLMKSSKK
ncbi:MAG TPA: CBS domain-containing protein [Candidatus Pacearchaeota archaeon]|nr:CBS domain-containing protein [Candidatus Pacearchaeota archaeon]